MEWTGRGGLPGDKHDGPVFNYNSAFKYTRVATDDEIHGGENYSPEDDIALEPSQRYPLINQLIHKLIVGVFYVTFIVTFPVSAFFCIQRIQSLQRCIVYRLGIRLPLKGPGLVIKFPFIDSIQIVDLSDYEFLLVDKTKQLMTSDGSIVEFSDMSCCLNVLNVIRSSAKLKDAQFNAQQFCRLSFANMIAGTHVEDLENKTDTILKQFEENCNMYLNDKGYTAKVEHLPKFVVINRANPLNPIVSKLMSMFGGGPDGSQTTNPMVNDLMRLQAPTSGQTELSEDQVVASLQRMAEKYRNYVFHDILISIQVLDVNSNEFFTFCHSTGKVYKVNAKPTNRIDINISADNTQQLMKFCCDNDMNSVSITTSLM